jgi:hypothetical protein
MSPTLERKHMTTKLNIPDQGQTQSLVEAAMRSLRSRHPSYLSEIVKEAIPVLAEKYEYMIAPEPIVPSKSATTKQLANIKKHGAALYVGVMSLQGPAVDALNFSKPTLGQLEGYLKRLVEASSRAEVPLEASGRKGPKLKARPRAIATAAAADYFRLTGKRPGRTNDRVDGKTKLSGEFVDFLSEIFKALGVVANVEHYAKEATSLWQSSRQSNTRAP